MHIVNYAEYPTKIYFIYTHLSCVNEDGEILFLFLFLITHEAKDYNFLFIFTKHTFFSKTLKITFIFCEI